MNSLAEDGIQKDHGNLVIIEKKKHSIFVDSEL